MSELFIGTKIIEAQPMTRLEYNDYRGWKLPADENGDDEGYLVEYSDGGRSNHPDHAGYISWSPKDVFERSYRDANRCMSFDHAIHFLKEGRQVQRKQWQAKGVYLEQEQTRLLGRLLYIYLCHSLDAQDSPGQRLTWIPCPGDLVAEDWILLEK